MKSLIFFILIAFIVIEASDLKDEAFKQCCNKVGMKCLNFCKYSPAEIKDDKDIGCMVEYFGPWLKCYTNEKDNTECCKNAKVAEISNIACLDFCDGKGHYTPDIKYIECPKAKEEISKCNHDNR